MRALKLLLKFVGILLALLCVTVASVLLWFGWQAGQRETQAASTLTPSTGRYVTVQDANVKVESLQVFVQEMGPTDGAAVLMVHGTGAWSGTWRPTMQVLAAAGFHAIAIDLPPFGFSERPNVADYEKATQGSRIVGVLDTLKVDRVFLVGHSFGGGPTMEAALQIPQRVRGIVLVDAALSVEAANENREVHEAPHGIPALVLGTPFLRDRVVATFLTNPLFTHRLLTLFIDNPERATDDWVGLYRQPLHATGTTAAISKWLPELLAPARVAISEKPSTYRALQIPLRLIWGERDSITPLAQAQTLAGLAPNAQLHVLPGIGHIPQIEAGSAFNAMLAEQLKQLARDHN